MDSASATATAAAATAETPIRVHPRGHKRVRTVTSRQTRLRSEKYHANITKRGQVTALEQEKKEVNKSSVSPILIGFLFFVLIGSTIFQMIRMAQSGPIF